MAGSILGSGSGKVVSEAVATDPTPGVATEAVTPQL